MASLTNAYARIREQTQANNAAGDSGVMQGMQEAFTGILGDLTKDFDPDNPIENRLSPIGEALDSVLNIRQGQIEKELNRRANLDEKLYASQAGMRETKLADDLENSIKVQAAENKSKALFSFDQNEATFDAKKSVKDFMYKALNKSPGLAATYSSFNTESNRHLWQIFSKEDTPGIQAGQLVYTDEETGQKLYATSDKDAKNLNYHHSKISTDMRTNINNAPTGSYSIEKIKELYKTAGGRAELFKNEDFKKVIKETLKNVPDEVLKSHGIYNTALKNKTKEIDAKLKDRSQRIASLIYKQQNDLAKFNTKNAAYLAANNKPTIEEQGRIVNKLNEYIDLQTRDSLDGSFRDIFRAKVHETAFVLSLLKGQKVEAGRAEIHIDQAIRLVMEDKDGEIAKYKKDLEYFYGIEKEKLQKSNTNVKPSITPAPASGKPGVLKKPAASSERVEPTGKAGL